MQSIALPILSLMVPNADAVSQDRLPCMWSVFTKCKDNLENGRRLENLSWRMWFRESTKRTRSKSTVNDTLHTVKRIHTREATPDRSPPLESFPHLLSSDQKAIAEKCCMYQNHPPCEQLPTPVSLQTNTDRRGKFFIPAEDDDYSDPEEFEEGSWEEDTEESTFTSTSMSIKTCTNIITSHNDHKIGSRVCSDDSGESFDYQKRTPTSRLDHTPASALSRLFKHCSSNANIPRQQLPLVERELPRNLKVCVEWERHQNMFPAGIRLVSPFSSRPIVEGDTSLLGW